jgi:hypothetical protein
MFPAGGFNAATAPFENRDDAVAWAKLWSERIGDTKHVFTVMPLYKPTFNNAEPAILSTLGGISETFGGAKT